MYDLVSVTKRHGSGSAGVDALRGIDLAVADGEMVGIIGPSGSGKSTLLQLLGALDVPTSGSVEFNGRDLASLTEGELTDLRRDDIGFVFQHFNLIPTLTALENIEVALVPGSLASEERREKSRQALGSVGLDDRAGHMPSQLSGGEQQRVAIARALAAGPKVLLADEPTGNLDRTNGAEVMQLLDDLHHAGGHTVLIVTHDTAIADQMPRVVELVDGEVARDGTTA